MPEPVRPARDRAGRGRADDDRVQRPRVYTSIPAALNAPVSFDLFGERLERDALVLLRAIEVRMLIVDKPHNLLAGTHRRRAEFLNMRRFVGHAPPPDHKTGRQAGADRDAQRRPA